MNGFFVDKFPAVKVVVGWNQKAATPIAILDTGFNGDLLVTPEIADDLGLEIVGRMNSKVANGQIFELPMALAVSAFGDCSNYVEVLISDGAPLMGVGFLEKFGCKAIIDCKNKIVVLEKA
jgi:predicted aspartyl protease